MKSVLILSLILLVTPSFASSLYERNWYADEVTTKFNNETYLWERSATVKTTWGDPLASGVVLVMTEDMEKWIASGGTTAYNRSSDHSRVTQLLTTEGTPTMVLNKVVSNTPAAMLSEYPGRISAYINTRQMSEVTKVTNNKLLILEPGAKLTIQTLINNLHPDYPGVHVIAETDGWTFARP